MVHLTTPTPSERDTIYNRKGMPRAMMAPKLGSCDRKALIVANLIVWYRMQRELCLGMESVLKSGSQTREIEEKDVNQAYWTSVVMQLDQMHVYLYCFPNQIWAAQEPFCSTTTVAMLWATNYSCSKWHHKWFPHLELYVTAPWTHDRAFISHLCTFCTFSFNYFIHAGDQTSNQRSRNLIKH